MEVDEMTSKCVCTEKSNNPTIQPGKAPTVKD